MGSDDLRLAMERLSRGLRDSLETSGAIGHALTRGEVRESEVIEALRPYLPMRYDLAKGEVIDAAGQRSRQQDIIISDALTGTPFLASGGMGVFPVEIVFAVLQIKSEIKPSTVAEAVENVVSAKRLASSEPRTQGVVTSGTNIQIGGATDAKPFGAIFAFSATNDLREIAQSFFTACLEIELPQDRPDALVVVDQALVAWVSTAESKLLARASDARCDGLALIEMPDALLYFYLTLHSALAEYQPCDLDLWRYTPTSGAVTTTWQWDLP
jgi:hypothetical protein